MNKIFLTFLITVCALHSQALDFTSNGTAFADTSLPTSTDMMLPAPESIKQKKSAVFAVFLSGLLPGCGHYYLGETQTGNEILGGALTSSACVYLSQHVPDVQSVSVTTLRSVSWYSMFAAYRDAVVLNGEAFDGLPREKYVNLAAAPFKWSVIKKPEVWGGVLGSLAVASTVVYFAYSDTEGSVHMDSSPTRTIEPLSALPIAIGEEALFRGLLQTSLSNHMPAWGAITLSSCAFGAAHIPNAWALEPSDRWRYYTYSIPLITGLGAYMGWLTHKNHSLNESVAVHAWYDFTLMALDAAASQAVIGKPAYISFSFAF